MTASITTSQSAKILGEVDVLSSASIFARSSGVARPILIRLMTTSGARFRPSASRASSTSTIAVGMPERACAVAMPAPISPAPSTPTRFTVAGLTDGSVTPGSRASRFFMKKTPIRLAEIGEPTQLAERPSARPSGPLRAAGCSPRGSP